MKKFELFLACCAENSGIARITIHLLAFYEGKESWTRAQAGIMREVKKIAK